MSLLLRPALYYPRLRFHSVDWLKETLLSFRQVRRIAPENFVFNDPSEVQELRAVDIPGLGPMVMDELVEDVWPERAQQRLYDWIRDRPRNELAAFDAEHAASEYGSAQTFQIHVGKFMETMLAFLQEQRLVWEPTQPEYRGDHWVAIHPRLGDALMTVMALAIAEHKQLNIVTTEPRVHHAVITRREEDVFASLARGEDLAANRREPKSAELASDAAQIVIHKALDLSWVKLQDVAAIVRDGNDFQRFQARLQTLASEHGWQSVADPKEQAKQAEALADAARAEWQTYRKQLGSYGKMFIDTAVEDKAETIVATTASMGLGAEAVGLAGVGAGLLVGILTVGTKALRKLVQRRKDDPYRYLSRMIVRGATVRSTTVADVAGKEATDTKPTQP